MRGAGGSVTLSIPAGNQAQRRFRAGASVNHGSISSQSMHSIGVSIPNIQSFVMITAPTEDRTFSVAPANGTITGNTSPYDDPPETRFSAGTWERVSSGNVSWNQSTDIRLALNPGHRHLANSALSITATMTNAQRNPSTATITAASVSGDAGDEIRTFRFNNIQGYVTNISVANIPRQTFSVEFRPGTAPTNGGAIAPTTQIPTVQKAFGVELRPVASPAGVPIFPSARYSVANANWEQVGWRTGSQEVLNHRNFANSGTTSATLFAPNGTTTWGAGTSVTDFAYEPVTWTTLQRTIPAMHNENTILFPIWAPQQTAVSFVQGAAPPGSGDRGGDTVVIQRLTGNQFAYPSVNFTINSGAIWEQVGWSRNPDINARIIPPLQTTLPSGSIANGHVITAGSTVSFEAWGTTRTYYPVWRRAPAQGSVNIQFIGAPHGFTETSLKTIDPNLSASMPFVVNGTQIFHTEDTTAQVLLPSINQMNTLGQAHGLIFDGWYIRTSWAPATQRICDTSAPGNPVVIPWQNGIFPTPWAPNEWEPYIWIEALWV